MLRTEPQRTASRLNGSLSKGPATSEGRLASSRNATKHGLSGSGKSLPPDMEQDLQSEVALFVSKFHPRDHYEYDLIRRAALGNLRARRIASTLNALTDDRVRNATRLWDESRSDEVASLAASLPHNPSDSVRLLLRTAEGCDFLGDAWDSLAQTLSNHGSWNESQARRALKLLGHSSPPPLTDDDPLSDFWRCGLALLFKQNPAATVRDYLQTESLRLLPRHADALETLSEFIRHHIAHLEAQGTRLWQTQDLPSRQSAPSRAAFEGTPETARLERYLAAAERLRRQSLEELHRLRKESPSQRNEPDTPPLPPLEGFTTPPIPFAHAPEFDSPDPESPDDMDCLDSSPTHPTPDACPPEDAPHPSNPSPTDETTDDPTPESTPAPNEPNPAAPSPSTPLPEPPAPNEPNPLAFPQTILNATGPDAMSTFADPRSQPA